MNTVDAKLAAVRRYADEFGAMAGALPGAGLPWLARGRRDAMERFRAAGFPTPRMEDWKYTSVAAIERGHFSLAPGLSESIPGGLLEGLRLSGVETDVLVFVNGRHAPGLSDARRLPAGVSAGSLADALAGQPEQLEALLTRPAGDDGFALLNGALFADGAFLRVARGTALERPLHLVYVATAPEIAAHVRNVLIVEEGAQATVIEHWIGLDGARVLTNGVTQVHVAANASLEHIKLQQEAAGAFHIAQIRASQARDSRFVSHSVALGAQLARNEIVVSLGAENAECTLNGLYMVEGRQHVDHHTRVDHERPHGTSREYYRGVLDGNSRAVFNGRVIVHPDAQKTDAQQSNNNLLLSRDAEVDTKPQLEIYADDVKCSHGATVGQLDPAQLFYLRSRGIDDRAARNLLTYAFANDVINRIRIASLRERIENVLLERLPEGRAIREYV